MAKSHLCGLEGSLGLASGWPSPGHTPAQAAREWEQASRLVGVRCESSPRLMLTGHKVNRGCPKADNARCVGCQDQKADCCLLLMGRARALEAPPGRGRSAAGGSLLCSHVTAHDRWGGATRAACRTVRPFPVDFPWGLPILSREGARGPVLTAAAPTEATGCLPVWGALGGELSFPCPTEHWA